MHGNMNIKTELTVSVLRQRMGRNSSLGSNRQSCSQLLQCLSM